MRSYGIKGLVVSLLLIIGGYSGRVEAYKEETHRLMSKAAFELSASLGSAHSGIYADIGLTGMETFVSSAGKKERIGNLIAVGAVEEDELALTRAVNHFFDPQNDGRPLTVSIYQGQPSPDWALEDRFSISSQQYSLADARERLFLALSSGSKAERDRFYGECFQRLGHVIHHIQDMSQPQHVRNDQHLPLLHTSLYEQWVVDRPQLLSSLLRTQYPTVESSTFRKAREFWSHQGKGAAEYTSRNFVSEGTNFSGEYPLIRTHPDYPLPAGVPCSVQKIPAAQLMPEDRTGSPVIGEVTFIGTQVTDAYRPELSGCNPRASSYSLFLTDLRVASANIGRGYRLNSYNFMSQLQRLAPRAVAYSAGLIDHFFRGRLAVESFRVEGSRATLVVKNVSRGDAALSNGADSAKLWEFAIYYDAQDGLRKRLDVLGGNIDGEPVGAGQTHALTFDYPQDLATHKDKPFMLVFDGTIGEEAGVAGLAFAAPALKGFVVQPSYLPQDGVQGPRLVSYEEGQWRLSDRSGLVAGNVDWRGDEAGEVLSWDGPPSRYFYPFAVTQGYSRRIYHQGRVLAQAPANVQGVAIRSEGTQRWLTVAVYSGSELRLYQRPFKSEYANDDLYHAQGNPDGWRLLQAAALQIPATPFFFNASGVQAQGIARGNIAGDRFRARVRVDIGATVTVSTSSAKGAGNWSVASSSRYSPTTTLIKGTGDVCAQSSEDALSHACQTQGTCSPPSGGVFPACRLKELEFRIDATGHRQFAMDYTFDRPTVVCADYRGDEEVLCTIDRDAASRSSIEYSRAYFSSSSITTTATCATEEVYRSTNAATGVTEVTNSTARVLRFGAVEIPIAGARGTNVFEEDGQITLTSGFNDYIKEADASVHNVSTEYDTRILYLDARHDLATVEFRNRTRTVSEQSNDLLQINGPVWSYPTQGTFTEETSRELAVFIGGQKHSLTRRIADTRSMPTSSTYQSFLGVGAPPNCRPSETSDGQAPQPFADDFTLDPHLLLFSGSQAYAVDGQGRVAVSQTIWEQQPDGSYQAGGVWNFLSNGNLAQLIPQATQNAAFYPIGVID